MVLLFYILATISWAIFRAESIEQSYGDTVLYILGDFFFTRYFFLLDLSIYEILVIIIIILVIIIIAWKFIEKPFLLNIDKSISRKAIFTLAIILIMIFSIVGSSIYFLNGMLFRHPDAVSIYEQARWEWYPNSIYGELEQQADQLIPGKFGLEDMKISSLIWGDSHAMALIPGIDELAKKYGLAGSILSHSVNAPLLGISIKNNNFNSLIFNENVMSYIKSHPDINTVFLAAHWSSYKPHELKLGLRNTIDPIIEMGKKVVLVTEAPSLKVENIVYLIYYNWRFPLKLSTIDYVSSSIDKYLDKNKDVNSIMLELSDNKNVNVIHLESILFGKDGNSIFLYNNIPLYRDGSHLSTYGSQFVSPIFEEIIKGIADSS
jgi:hypothetical protein